MKRLTLILSTLLVLSSASIPLFISTSCSSSEHVQKPQPQPQPQPVNPTWNINFKQNSSFNFGISDKTCDDATIDNTWIRDIIATRYYEVFDISSDKINIDKQFFLNNINLQQRTNNLAEGYLSINCVLSNYSNSSQNNTINKTITITGFKKQQLSQNQTILQNCVNALRVNCSLTEQEKSEIKPSQAISGQNSLRIFSFNEREIRNLGGSTNGFQAKTKPDYPNSVFIDVLIWVGRENAPDYQETTITVEFDGFKSDLDIGTLDAKQSPNLPTPVDAKSWKGKLGMINNNGFISQGSYEDKTRAYGWKDVTKEFAYHARFILYQSFKDNFSEINYYSYEDNRNITVIAEGIVQNNENRTFWVQSTGNGTGTLGNGNVQIGNKIKITYRINKNTDPLGLFNAVDAMNWSFANDCNLIDGQNTKNQFGIVLPGYSLNITNNDKNIYSFSAGHIRTYSFVIGRFKKN